MQIIVSFQKSLHVIKKIPPTLFLTIQYILYTLLHMSVPVAYMVIRLTCSFAQHNLRGFEIHLLKK